MTLIISLLLGGLPFHDTLILSFYRNDNSLWCVFMLENLWLLTCELGACRITSVARLTQVTQCSLSDILSSQHRHSEFVRELLLHLHTNRNIVCEQGHTHHTCTDLLHLNSNNCLELLRDSVYNINCAYCQNVSFDTIMWCKRCQGEVWVLLLFFKIIRAPLPQIRGSRWSFLLLCYCFAVNCKHKVRWCNFVLSPFLL